MAVAYEQKFTHCDCDTLQYSSIIARCIFFVVVQPSSPLIYHGFFITHSNAVIKPPQKVACFICQTDQGVLIS